ncbi:hypothetical protein MNBD_GAMMA10-2936 [hydrothermal vent metagenome]|uniref:DUF3301 domain-containing protein n=1 Tax=hydrothermal vent metagenome TaxID=652676 RepID=A0A3B0XEY1_9ZZZZ
MYITELFIIMLLVLLLWFWLESMRVNEIARSIGARICKENNVQFLDDTVHLSGIRLGKNSYGQVKFLRSYGFEFTNSELHRYSGRITLADKLLQSSEMDVYRTDEYESDTDL